VKNTLMYSENTFTNAQLSRLKKLPLMQKVALTERRLSQFYAVRNGMVYVSFSGGKDSTVLLSIARRLFPEIKGVFIDTGLEYPEIREFVKTIENIDWVKPTKTFKAVIDKYGYPLPSKEIAEAVYEYRTTKSEKLKSIRMKKLSGKWNFLLSAPFKISHKCCNELKKKPAKRYEKENKVSPIIGTMTEESYLRKSSFMRHGCNIYTGPRPKSNPLSFWTEKDIWEYIKQNSLAHSTIYNKGYERTGCVFCLFGAFNKKDTRFDRMKKTHPAQYKYCMENLGLGKVIDYVIDGLKRTAK
jgi:3'-phosphoadenosine 5'-phosphosulfate sulfotransferase (PAPS reductase)/FAD synthetase